MLTAELIIAFLRKFWYVVPIGGLTLALAIQAGCSAKAKTGLAEEIERLRVGNGQLAARVAIAEADEQACQAKLDEQNASIDSYVSAVEDAQRAAAASVARILAREKALTTAFEKELALLNQELSKMPQSDRCERKAEWARDWYRGL